MSLFLLVVLQAPAAIDTSVRITTRPERPFIEYGQGVNYLNFDFVLENTGTRGREIGRITLSVFDGQGRLAHRQFISADGAAVPAMETIPKRVILAGGSVALFNPFYTLPAHLPLDRLQVEFAFGTRGIVPLQTVVIDVSPRAWRPATRLMLPLDGPAIVYDGHDFYSHHRRIPLDNEFTKRTGLATNPVRYANDWTPVGPNGQLSRGSLEAVREWYAYGAKVRAPAGGVVVSGANNVPDNRVESGQLIVPEGAGDDFLRASLGNHLIIRHRDGEFTLLAHLRSGTVHAAVGDTVRQGQIIGEIGFSGDTGFHVHLHQMLMSAPTFSAEGLPSYFDGVQRAVMGETATAVGPVLNRTRLDTGDLVIPGRRKP